MEIRATLRTSVVWLLVTIVAVLLNEITAHSAFSWMSMIAGVGLFLTLYWLGICCLEYLYETFYRKEQEAMIKEPFLHSETELLMPNDLALNGTPRFSLEVHKGRSEEEE